jgi:hypothetical protein
MYYPISPNDLKTELDDELCTTHADPLSKNQTVPIVSSAVEWFCLKKFRIHLKYVPRVFNQVLLSLLWFESLSKPCKTHFCAA